MALEMYGLSATDKEGRAISCMTVAESESEARRQAQEHGNHYGVDWTDIEAVQCSAAWVMHGEIPPKGFVAFTPHESA